MGISQRTLYNKIATFPNSGDLKKYSDVTEAQLDVIIQRIKKGHPNDGEIMVAGHLLRQGIRVQRAKLRESIHHVDLE